MTDLIEREAVLKLITEHFFVWPKPSGAVLWDDVKALPAATATGTKPSLNWDHLRPDLVAIARDENGAGYGYPGVPVMDEAEWLATDGDAWCVYALASYTPGTCDWRDSLVMRPGHKGDAE